MSTNHPNWETHKRSHVALLFFFIISLLAGLGGSFIGRDLMPDFREQRVLAPFPSIANISELYKLPVALTNFMADNFGLRKPIISAYFWFRLKLLQASLGLPAFLGQDGWLFIDAEAPDFRHQNVLDAIQKEKIRTTLDAWCEYAHERGAEFVFFVGPNKSTIYKEKMPLHYKVFSHNTSLLDQVNAIDFNCRFVRADVRQILLENREKQLYYKWGTHWNDHAALLAWRHIKDVVGSSLHWPSVRPTISYRSARALEDSMWQWFGQNDPYIDMLPQMSVEDLPESSLPQSSMIRAKILVFGDSFLTFMRGAVGVVANNYSGWVLSHHEKFTYQPQDIEKDAWLITAAVDDRRPEIMEVFKPNLVMVEVVERNILTIADMPLPQSSSVGVGDKLDASFYLTDDHWVNGFARNWAGFFVPNTIEMQKKYVVGRNLGIANEQVRSITRVEANGAYLNVYISGAPIDGHAVGYPDEVKVLK